MKAMGRPLLAIAVVMVTAVPGGRAAFAQQNEPFLSLSGPRSAYVDVRFDKKFTLDEEATKISFKGSFGGWLMHRRGEPIDVAKGNIVGAYVIREVAPSPGSSDQLLFNIGFKERNLAPGVYRVYLLADAPTKVTIPIVSGAPAMRLSPDRPTAARATTAEIEVNQAGVVNDSSHEPVRITSNTLSASAIYLHAGPGVTVQNVQACIKEEAGGSCEEGGIAGYVIHALQDYDFALNTIYAPGRLKAGRYQAFQQAMAGSVERVVGASFTVQLNR